MRPQRCAVIAVLLLCFGGLVHGALEYPLTVALEARAKNDVATVAAKVSITVERLIEPNRRIRASDALKYGGYLKFVPVLRALPPIGTITVGKRTVEIRYAHEEQRPNGPRLVLVVDRPLFFLGDSEKPRAGYELTIVELLVDEKGMITGTMTGAARVKPDPDGAVVLDDYADTPVQLSGRVTLP